MRNLDNENILFSSVEMILLQTIHRTEKRSNDSCLYLTFPTKGFQPYIDRFSQFLYLDYNIK